MDFLGIRRIVSGGQTGVDRAALDVAISMGIQHGGWCPRGRIAEDGVIPGRYQLVEMDSAEYSVRTRQNVVDSDGTLILYEGKMTSGTALTNRIAKELGVPLHRIRLNSSFDLGKVASWILDNQLETLNVAGPRGSSNPQIYDLAYRALQGLFSMGKPLLQEESRKQ